MSWAKVCLMVRVPDGLWLLHILVRFGVNNSAITNDTSQCCDAQSFDIRSFCCPPKQHGEWHLHYIILYKVQSPATRSKKTSAPDRPNCCKGGPGLQPWVTHLLQGWQGTSELSQPTSSSSRTRDLGWHKVRQRGFCSLAMYLASET